MRTLLVPRIVRSGMVLPGRWPRLPIRRIRLVDDFGGDDERFMLADDMSAFNRRLVPGTNVKDSMHFSANGLWEGSLAKVAVKEGAAK